MGFFDARFQLGQSTAARGETTHRPTKQSTVAIASVKSDSRNRAKVKIGLIKQRSGMPISHSSTSAGEKDLS